MMYIHGYGSSYNPNSSKVQALMTIGDVCGINIDYTKSINNITTLIESAILEIKPDLLIGTSMGAFYANRLGNLLDIPFVMLNPAIEPNITLAKVGVTDENLLSSYSQKFIPKGVGLLFLNLGDELIDSHNTNQSYHKTFRTYMFNGGDHRFEDISATLNVIKQFYDTLEFTIGTEARLYRT